MRKKLSLFLNTCVNVENNIKNINEIIDSIKKCKNSENKKISFIPEDDETINHKVTFNSSDTKSLIFMDYIMPKLKKTSIYNIPVYDIINNSLHTSEYYQNLVRNKNDIKYGTGFFMKISDTKKYLITNYHILSEEKINQNIEIEIHNNRKMRLNMNERDIRYYPEPKDITVIEMKINDDIYNDIEFLFYDTNYIHIDYEIYKNSDIFSIYYSKEERIISSGKIININEYDFTHNLTTDYCASGSPIILNNNIDLIQVMGIQKGVNILKNYNYGTFIAEIFNNNVYSNNLNNKNNNMTNNNNYIIAEIEIKGDNLNQRIRIINSYEEFKRTLNDKIITKEERNEEEIKKCEIKINNELITFNYYYIFPKEGKYIIKYSFKNNLTKTNYLFSDCGHLKIIDLSNFNTLKVDNMSCMFFECFSLTDINLSNINTPNVENMSGMFAGCKSLTNINLSNFNTQNVINMSLMFGKCSSLTNINLSNFQTHNVTDMSYMFAECSSLKDINLSNFNTQNVTDMSSMFVGCESLTNINLSNFNTQNVTDMCCMFKGCNSLKKENLIVKDNKILKEFENF